MDHGLVTTESMLDMGEGWDMESASWRAEGRTSNCLLANIKNSRAFSCSLTCPLCKVDSVGTVRLLNLHQILHILIYLWSITIHIPACLRLLTGIGSLFCTWPILYHPRAQKLPLKTISCWVVLICENPYQLGTYSRLFPDNKLLWDPRPSHPFPLFSKPTTHATNTLLGRKNPCGYISVYLVLYISLRLHGTKA